MIKKYQTSARRLFAVWCVGLIVLAMIAYSKDASLTYVFIAIFVANIGVFYAALSCYLRARARSLWWLLLPFCLNVLGACLLLFLGDKSTSQNLSQEPTSITTKEN